jgi:hypothetical protein
MCYVRSMAQNQNITDSLNIIHSLIEKKNIDDSIKNVFYYFSNLYLKSKGFDSHFPKTEFKSENVKEENARAIFIHSSRYNSKIKSNLTDNDILNYFTIPTLGNNKNKNTGIFQEFAINFEKKTVNEKLEFVKKNVFHKSCHLPRFLVNMLYHDGNEEIKSRLSKFLSNGINLETYGDYITLNNLYNVVGKDEFVKIVFYNHDGTQRNVNINNILDFKEVGVISGLEILAAVFLYTKENNMEMAKNIILKFLDLNEKSPLVVSRGIYGDMIASIYFIIKFIPKIVFYANMFDHNTKEEILSKLIDSCMTSKLRTNLKEDNFIRELSLFEIVRSIVELETNLYHSDGILS